MKVIPVLLLLVCSLSSYSQNKEGLAILKKVMAAMDSKFKPFIGEIKYPDLADTVYHSKVEIEATTENEVFRHGETHIYFALLDKDIALERARIIARKWNVSISGNTKGFKALSKKLQKTIGDSEGFQYIKSNPRENHVIDIYISPMETTTLYCVGLMFTVSQKEQ
jgi:uncharacterized protein YlxP (DUF503 family)